MAEIRAQVEAGKITWDVVDLEVSDAARGCDDGLFEKISAGSLPNGVNGALPSKDFIPGAARMRVGTIVWSTIYAYDADKYKSNQQRYLTSLM